MADTLLAAGETRVYGVAGDLLDGITATTHKRRGEVAAFPPLPGFFNQRHCPGAYLCRSTCRVLNVNEPNTAAFEKARAGLWTSLQKHLLAVYAAEKDFQTATAFVEAFPVALHTATDAQQADYWAARNALRDLYTDETAQLDTLGKAIRTKGYSEDQKKQLYLLILGYMDIAASIFELLHTHVPTKLPDDEALTEAAAKFERVRKFARLNVKGIVGLLG